MKIMPVPKDDIHFIVRRIPRDVRKIMQDNPNIILAGGFIRSVIAGEKPSDIDIFSDQKESLIRIAQSIALDRHGRVHSTENAITVLAPPRIPLQFITKWTYDNIDNLLLSFDFTIAQVGIRCIKNEDETITWVGYYGERFYQDLAARRLYYTSPIREEAPGGSILRVRKFLSKGYNIQAGSLSRIIARLVGKIEYNHFTENENGLSQVIAGLLREVDPLVVVDGLEVIDEHEII